LWRVGRYGEKCFRIFNSLVEEVDAEMMAAYKGKLEAAKV
jgi:hypothetical protein